MKKFIALLMLWTPAQAQFRHSITVDYTGSYFWGASGGGPFRFEMLPHWFNIPGTLNYSITKNRWGVTAGYSYYLTYYNGSRGWLDAPAGSLQGALMYSRTFSALNINLLRELAGGKRMDVFATAGYTHYFVCLTGFAYQPFAGEVRTSYVHNGENLSGINFGFQARYRPWKGITLQATATHTKIFGGEDFNHLSNLRIGYGYTFGGGMNRNPKRTPAP